MIITRTPYRLSFFGGGTDYNAWFEEQGGIVIASAMARYCYLTVRYSPPFFGYKTRAIWSYIESVHSNQEINHPSIRNCLKFLNMEEGLVIHYDGDLPARSGIGSSSTFTVGLLHALHALRHEMVPQSMLADEAILVEQTFIGEDVGIQDQIMAAHGGLQVIEMGPGKQYKTKLLILPPDYLKSLEQHILLGFTGISRNSNGYAKQQVQNIQQGISYQYLNEIHSLAKEALHLFQKKADFLELGKLLDQSWQMKKQLTQKLSNEFIDNLYKQARHAGAYGGKLMGAGGGGFVMFLAPPERHPMIKEALAQIKIWVPFKIDHLGSQVIFYTSYDETDH